MSCSSAASVMMTSRFVTPWPFYPPPALKGSACLQSKQWHWAARSFASTSPCLTEICGGDGALFAESDNPEAWLRIIKKIKMDGALRQS